MSPAKRRWARIQDAHDNPKKAARRAVKEAVRVGELVRPTVCSKCPSDGRIDAHHPDYSKPLDVVWLCGECHADLHPELPRHLFVRRPS